MSKNIPSNHFSEEESEREIVSKRIFHVSRENIFNAFSDPKHLVNWWGPKGFTNTFKEFDMRPDGVWRYTMHGPNGVDYENKSIFVGVKDPERIVLRHLEPPLKFLLTITFSEVGNKTEVIWRMLFETEEECSRVRTFAAEGNEQNFDRLEEELEKMTLNGD